MNIITSNFTIRKFEESDINKNFINSLNNKKLNQFLHTGKKKQKLKDALNFFNHRKKNKDIYLIIFNKKRLVGTITYKKYKRSSFFLGYAVLNESYIGGDLFFKANNHIFYSGNVGIGTTTPSSLLTPTPSPPPPQPPPLTRVKD